MKVRILKTPNTYSDGGNIHIKKSHEGIFTKKALRAGMGVLEFAEHVLANKDKYSPATVKLANFAHNASSFEHAYGGNLFSDGGMVLGGYHTNGVDWDTGVRTINTGGTHEENLNQGIQQGVDSQGNPNLVEENEVVYNDYVFSNRLTVPKRRKGKEKEISDLAWEEKILKEFEGMTYADAAEKAYKRAAERPMDQIEKRGLEAILGVLAGSLEKERTKNQYKEASEEIDNMSGQEFMLQLEAERQLMELALMEQLMQLEQAMLQEQMTQQLPTEEEMMLAQLMQGLQAMQQMSPEELAMLQLQLAMLNALISALGGNIHAYGGNFYDDGGLIGLTRLPDIFNELQQYVLQGIEENRDNPEVLALLQLLLYRIQLSTTNDDKFKLINQLLAAKQQLQEALINQPQQQLYAYGGRVNRFDTGGDFDDWFAENIDEDYANTIKGGITGNVPLEYIDLYTTALGQKPYGLTADDIFNTLNQLYETNAEIFIEDVLDYVNNLLELRKRALTAGLQERIAEEFKGEKSEKTQSLSVKEKKELNRKKKEIKAAFDRYYKQRGVNPEKLDKISYIGYQRDLNDAYKSALEDDKYDFTTDKELFINSDALGKGRRKNMDIFTTDAMDRYLESVGGLDITDTIGDSGIPWDPVEGLSEIDNSADGFYENLDNLITDNGVYKVDGQGNEYTSLFNDLDELSQYYVDKLTDYFKDLKGKDYNKSKLASYYLSGKDLRGFVNSLAEGNDKDKELSELLKANWGDKDTKWDATADWEIGENGTVKESASYKALPLVKGYTLRNDALPGIEHIPFLAAKYGDPSYERYWYTDDFGRKRYTLRPEGDAFTFGDPKKVTVGDRTFVDREIRPLEVRRLFHKSKSGKIWDLTNANLDKGLFSTLGYNVLGNDYSQLGKGVKGKPAWLGFDEGADGSDEFPLYNDKALKAGLGLLTAALLATALTPNDYSNANAVINAARRAGEYIPIAADHVGQYLKYRPLDVRRDINDLNSAMEGERRRLENLSGGNRSQAAANILTSDYNLVSKMGDLQRGAEAANRDQEATVATFNRDTDKTNIENDLKAAMANQEAASRAVGSMLDGLIKGYGMKLDIADNKMNSINAGINGIALTIMTHAQNKWLNELLGWGMRHLNWGNMAKDGGKLRTRRRKGLSI